ncbi:uncharacterized protein LOC130220326 [Danio aesculapii]|uniref:uncharacterized protein LOC130220326 n=1 Tax=Danio aesculapii TaxID=1142201 RepID=UPI0024C05B4B|nr:uncharacterized protein LOC130220326 [Danio aesculapii]
MWVSLPPALVLDGHGRMCALLQRLQPPLAAPVCGSQGVERGREEAFAGARRWARGHAEDGVPGARLPEDAGPPRQTPEAARRALRLGQEGGYGPSEASESGSRVAVVAVHSTDGTRGVSAGVVLRGGTGTRRPGSRASLRRPPLQARNGAHTGPALRAPQAGGQGEVRPAPIRPPLSRVEEGGRGEEEQAGKVVSCPAGTIPRPRPRARGGPRSPGGLRACGSLRSNKVPVPGPRPRLELSMVMALLCWAGGGCMSSRLTFDFRPRSADLLLAEFEGFQLGSEPTARLRNNVASKLARVKAFLGFMATGHADPETLSFLNQPARIRAWSALLGQTGMAEPTRQHYLKNVAQFLDYLSETPPASCRLSSTTLVLIRRELRALIRGIRRRVVVHEVRTKQAKEGRLISKATLLRCHRTAGRKIPALLDGLESSPDTRQQWRFYGYLTGYLTCITGHRCGVFQNLTIQEVQEASRSPDESAYVINITTHKTNRAFGAAQLSLNKEEYSWFRRFLQLRASLPGGSQASYFFFTSRPSPCRTLNKYFQSAWTSMGLPGKPTFTDVRTAIATHAKNSHSSEDRRKVAQFMCHDTSTSDKFYALHLGPLQAREHRRLFERALVEEEEEEEEEEAAGRERHSRKGRQRAESPGSPMEGTSRRTLPWPPSKGKRPLEATEDSESS